MSVLGLSQRDGELEACAMAGRRLNIETAAKLGRACLHVSETMTTTRACIECSVATLRALRSTSGSATAGIETITVESVRPIDACRYRESTAVVADLCGQLAVRHGDRQRSRIAFGMMRNIVDGFLEDQKNLAPLLGI